MHEAGHAIIHVYFGLSINSITIIADGDVAGSVAHPSPLLYTHHGRRVVKQVVREIVIALYAGLLAQRIYDPEAPDFHADNDEDEAWRLPREYAIHIPGCSFVGDDAYDRYLQQRRNESRKLVFRLRPVIEALAEELLKRGTMQGQAVELFVNQKLGRVD